MEEWKAQNQSILAQYDAEQAQDRELFRSVITSGQAALKSAILINGGAVVALLAFIGGVFKNLSESSSDSEVISKLSYAMIYFVAGVLSGAVASGITYLAQYAYAFKKWCIGHILTGVIVLLVFGCYILFVVGVTLAYEVF